MEVFEKFVVHIRIVVIFQIQPGAADCPEILHRIGDEVRPGDELARFHLRKPDPTLASRATACFQIADDATAPPLIVGRVE